MTRPTPSVSEQTPPEDADAAAEGWTPVNLMLFGLFTLLFTHVVVGEEDGQHRVVGPAPHSVTRVATLLHDLGDLETARPMRVEPRSNFDAAPRMHAPDAAGR